MMNENDCILSVQGLDIRFNLRGRVLHAIRGIDLDLYRGEVLAVVGESGSGKSVFTKSFMGLLDTNGSITGGTIDYCPTPGAEPVRLSGLKTEKDWLRIRGREIAMIMQDPPEPAENHRRPDFGGRDPASGPEGHRGQGQNTGIPAGRGHL